MKKFAYFFTPVYKLILKLIYADFIPQVALKLVFIYYP